MDKELLKLIETAKKQLGKIQKDGKNPHFKSTYMTLNGIMAELQPVLDANGLSVFQYVHGLNLVTVVAINGTEASYRMEMPLIGASNMQQLGSAITYARRYSLVAIFSILDKDDDGEQAVGRTKDTITAEQLSTLREYNGQEVIDRAGAEYGCGVRELTKKQADAMIEYFKKGGN